MFQTSSRVESPLGGDSSVKSSGRHNVHGLVLFGLFLIVYLPLDSAPDDFLMPIQNLTGYSAMFLANLLGLTSSYNPANTYLEISGFTMRILFGCTPVTLMVILACAILLTPAREWRAKTVAAFWGVLILFACNLVRLVLLGVLGHYIPDMFSFLHEGLSPFFFLLLSVGIYIYWNERSSQFVRLSYRLGSLLALSTLCLTVLNLFRSEILALFARGIDFLTTLGLNDLTLKQKLWFLSERSIPVARIEEAQLVFQLPGKTFTLFFWQDVISLSLFLGIALLVILMGQYGGSFRLWLIKSLLGGFSYSFFLVAGLSLVGILLQYDNGAFFAEYLLVIIHVCTLMLPLVLWRLLFKKNVNAARL